MVFVAGPCCSSPRLRVEDSLELVGGEGEGEEEGEEEEESAGLEVTERMLDTELAKDCIAKRRNKCDISSVRMNKRFV